MRSKCYSFADIDILKRVDKNQYISLSDFSFGELNDTILLHIESSSPLLLSFSDSIINRSKELYYAETTLEELMMLCRDGKLSRTIDNVNKIIPEREICNEVSVYLCALMLQNKHGLVKQEGNTSEYKYLRSNGSLIMRKSFQKAEKIV